ncbi:zinc ribbon domain-containing protein [Peribacillus sp. NPDC097284]|uniref:zinc ribbon domain-containing protein n=1 Tax=Peribacillus sp. NPDC097284 TaxID=3364401 RepID=UPI00381476E4
MFCTTCGESNPDYSNYCSHDGTALGNSSSLQQLQLVNNETNFCPECGEGTNKIDNYCISCGNSLLKFGTTKISMNEKVTPRILNSRTFSFTSLLSKDTLRKALIPAIAAFILMLLLNLLVYTTNTNFYEDIFEESFGFTPEEAAENMADESGFKFKEPGAIFGFSDTVMMSHTLSPSYTLDMESNNSYEDYKGSGELSLSFTYVLFIIIPLLCLFVSGIVYRKKHTDISIQSFLSGAVGIALIYSLLLTFLSLFSGFDYKIKHSESGESLNLAITTAYPFFQTFFKGLLFGIVFSMLGMLFSINYRQITKQLESLIPYGNAVHQGFSAFIRGFVTLTIVMVAILISKMNDAKEMLSVLDVPGVSQQILEKTTLAACYLGVQLSSIVYSMLHFTPLSLKGEGDGESGEISFSVFSGFSTDGDVMEGGDLSYLDLFFSFTNIDLYLKLAMILPILLLIFAGYSMAKSKQSSFVSLAVLSLVYSLFVSAIASFSAISLNGLFDMGDGENAITFSLGVSVVQVFIGSFILSYIAGFAGSYLNKFFPGSLK